MQQTTKLFNYLFWNFPPFKQTQKYPVLAGNWWRTEREFLIVTIFSIKLISSVIDNSELGQ